MGHCRTLSHWTTNETLQAPVSTDCKGALAQEANTPDAETKPELVPVSELVPEPEPEPEPRPELGGWAEDVPLALSLLRTGSEDWEPYAGVLVP